MTVSISFLFQITSINISKPQCFVLFLKSCLGQTQLHASEQKKLNRMQITVKVDEQNFRVLHEMMGHTAGAKGINEIRVPDKSMHREAMGDTGSTV